MSVMLAIDRDVAETIDDVRGGLTWLTDGFVSLPDSPANDVSQIGAPLGGLSYNKVALASVVALGCPKCDDERGSIRLIWIRKAL